METLSVKNSERDDGWKEEGFELHDTVRIGEEGAELDRLGEEGYEMRMVQLNRKWVQIWKKESPNLRFRTVQTQTRDRIRAVG